MPIKLKNNASDFLAQAVTDTDTSVVLQSGDTFPELASGEYFYATIQDVAGQLEIVKVTGKFGDTFSIERGQEGTGTASFPAGSKFDLRVTVASIEGGTYTPDGTGAEERTIQEKLREFVNIKDFGAVCDGATDDAAAVQAAFDYLWGRGGGTLFFPKGNTRIESTVDLWKSSGRNVTLQGEGGSVVSTTQDIVVFLIGGGIDADNLSITQSGSAKTGSAFQTPTNIQLIRNRFTRLAISNFKYGFWARCSLWVTWDRIYFNNCGCGIKFSRNNDPNDQTNPAAGDPLGWNSQPPNGFFHNENMLSNVLCNGGEVGIWGTVNGCVFDAVTCQNQDGDPSGNTVIPVGVERTGIWLQGGEDSPGSRFGSQGNLISHFYAEETRQAIVVSRAAVRISSFFIQGGQSGDRYPQPIKVINTGSVNGIGCATSGSDFFDNRLVVDSTSRVDGAIATGASSGNVSDIDGNYFPVAQVSSNQYFTLTGSGLTRTLFTVPRRVGAVRVICTVLRDGSAIRYGSWTVYFYQSGIGAVVADSENSINATLTLSGSDVVYTTTDALEQRVIAHVVPLAYFGNTRSTGLFNEG